MWDSEWEDSFTWLWEGNNWLYNHVTWFRIIINKWSVCMCVSAAVCSVETRHRETELRYNGQVEAQLFYSSVLIPHSLSCWLTDRQHIVYQLHTLGTRHTDWHKDRHTKKMQYAKNREFSRNQDCSDLMSINLNDCKGEHKQYNSMAQNSCRNSDWADTFLFTHRTI